MTSSSRLALAMAMALTWASPMLSSQSARAQTSTAPGPTARELETARALYKEGKELRARGDLAGALEKLQAAHALGNTPVTGIELARTYVMVGHIVEAREVCLYIARLGVAADETEKSVAARSEAARLADELQPRIPTLRVKVEGLQAGERARLSIDGGEVPGAALGEPQKVNPGKHAVAIRVGDGAAAREVSRDTEVTEGQTGQITLALPAAPVVPAPVVPGAVVEPEAPARTRDAGWVVKLGFGTAAAGGAMGLVAGVVAWSKKGQLAGECPDHDCRAANGGSGDLATARSWATVSTVAFAVGGAGVLVGLLGLVTGPPRTARHDEPRTARHDEARTARDDEPGVRVSPWIGLGAAGLDGRF
jgi:hypothetical protein